MKRAIQLTVSLIVGGACLAFAVQGVPLDELPAAIAKLPWTFHLAYFALVIFQFVIRSARWRLQAEGTSGRSVTFREALAINAIAFAAVFLLPFRLGELVRPALCAQRSLMSASAGMANTAVERIIDGLVTTAFFGVVLFVLGRQDLPPFVTAGAYGALALFGTGFVVLAAGYRWRAASAQFWHRLIAVVHRGLASKLVTMLEAFLDGLGCFKSRRDMGVYLLYTLLFWGMNGAQMWLILVGMGADAELVVGYFVVSFLVVGVMIPAPPGNVGTMHGFATLSLTLLGYPETLAFAFAVIVHAWQVVALTVWAALFVALGDISLARVRDATRAEADGPAEAGSASS